MIIKAGGSPSISIQKSKGKKIKFRNGIYTINHDIYVIRWNKANSRIIRKSKLKKRNGKFRVFDIELEKNHILMVRRNGKAYFSGNCRCVLVVR